MSNFTLLGKNLLFRIGAWSRNIRGYIKECLYSISVKKLYTNGEGVEFKRLPYGMPTLPSYKLNGEWVRNPDRQGDTSESSAKFLYRVADQLPLLIIGG